MRILLLFLLVIFSCSKPVPKGVFPPQKMEAVLYDVIRADELADFSTIMDSTYRNFSKRAALYDSIFHIHSISKEDYKKSMQFYQSRPDLLKEILDSLYTKTTPPKADTTIKSPIIRRKIKPQ